MKRYQELDSGSHNQRMYNISGGIIYSYLQVSLMLLRLLPE